MSSIQVAVAAAAALRRRGGGGGGAAAGLYSSHASPLRLRPSTQQQQCGSAGGTLKIERQAGGERRGGRGRSPSKWPLQHEPRSPQGHRCTSVVPVTDEREREDVGLRRFSKNCRASFTPRFRFRSPWCCCTFHLSSHTDTLQRVVVLPSQWTDEERHANALTAELLVLHHTGSWRGSAPMTLKRRLAKIEFP